jgi:hypothetical protein
VHFRKYDTDADSISLIPETSATSSVKRGNLVSQLEGMNVWKVEAISILHYIKDTSGREDKGYVKFTNQPKSIDIYILTNTAHKETMISHRISEFLIKFCNIAGTAQQNLVLPIVAYPHEEIQKMLEEHSLAMSAQMYESFRSGDIDVWGSSGKLSYPILRNQRARTPDLHTRTSSFGYSGTSKLRAKSQDWNPSSHRSIRSERSRDASDASSPHPRGIFGYRKQIKVAGMSHQTRLNSSSEQSENSDRSSTRSGKARSSDSESEESDERSSENAFDVKGLRSALPKISGVRVSPLREPQRRISYGRRKSACMHCRTLKEGDLAQRQKQILIGELGEKHVSRFESPSL